MSSTKLTELNNREAKKFFRDEKNYVNFDLPPYFSFKNILLVAAAAILNKKFSDFCKNRNGSIDYPRNYEKVNYTILGNKDGSFAWRPFQLIHPILYVDLVNLITDANNWQEILDRFRIFSKGCVECISIPRVSQNEVSHKASQVMHWWEEIEQRSIKMALKYNYIFTTDIANCYPSIYTHSLEWALAEGGMEEIKNNRINHVANKTLGAQIDEKLRNMNYGQTNGIPQGSTLMDFIAEIVLGYGDLVLTSKLKDILSQEEFNDFHILRYRDDYKIFVNNPVVGHKILMELSNSLHSLNLKMSPEKTSENTDIILSSIKKEKLERIFVAPLVQTYQKDALRIYQISKKHPNSGLVAKELSLFYDRIIVKNELSGADIEVLISIFTAIGLTSPKLIHWISAVVSKLLFMLNNNEKSIEITAMIHRKFKIIPNTGFIDVWLQRISAPLGIATDYNDPITKLALNLIPNSQIWESSWLSDDIASLLDSFEVSNLKTLLDNESLPSVIPRKEVELFKMSYNF